MRRAALSYLSPTAVGERSYAMVLKHKQLAQGLFLCK